MRTIRTEWLLAQADDGESRRRIVGILEERDRVARTNAFPKGDGLFPLRLGGRCLWFRESSAFSSIEVYCEVFGEDGRFRIEGFSGKGIGSVVDVGANAGYYALRIREESPACALHCIEPNPRVFEILERNISSNGLAGVVLTNKALSGAPGRLHIDIVPEIDAIGGRGVREVDRPWMRESFIERIEVESVTLDGYCSGHGIASIDLLKIDTEGMEVEILQGGREILRSVGKVIVERHSPSLRHEVNGILNGLGFSLVHEEDPGLTRYYGDMFFARERSPL